jgi:hypothetical protein
MDLNWNVCQDTKLVFSKPFSLKSYFKPNDNHETTRLLYNFFIVEVGIYTKLLKPVKGSVE